MKTTLLQSFIVAFLDSLLRKAKGKRGRKGRRSLPNQKLQLLSMECQLRRWARSKWEIVDFQL